jgi:hypothetical protein
LRLRKNLVELRARLSLLVDKTTFQYSALTIYYTTIGGHAPPSTHQHRSRGERDAMDALGSPPQAPHDAGKLDALNVPGSAPPRPPCAEEGGGDTTDAPGSPLAAAATEGWDAPGSAHRHPRRGGRGRGGAVPDHPQRQHAAEEGTPRTFRIIPNASTPRKKGRPGPSGSSPTPARRGRRDAPDLPDHPQRRTPRGKRRHGRAGPSTSASTARGRHRVPFFRSFASMICIFSRVTCTSFRV